MNAIADILVKLCKKGYKEKILLSNDYCIHSDFCNRDKNGMHLSAEEHTKGLGYVFNEIHNAYISNGGNERDWNQMLCKNPINILDK